MVLLEQKGIEVIVVVGDTGWDKGSEEESADGVTFLASGINNSYYKSKAPDQLNKIGRDKVLEFLLIPNKRKFVWQFMELNTMAGLSLQEWIDN